MLFSGAEVPFPGNGVCPDLDDFLLDSFFDFKTITARPGVVFDLKKTAPNKNDFAFGVINPDTYYHNVEIM